VAQYLASPTVVVPGDPEDVYTTVLELGECCQRAKAAAWNHRFPFEPEVEKIAVDYQRARFPSQSAEKRDEGALDLGTCDSQVRVRHDVAGGVEHGSS